MLRQRTEAVEIASYVEMGSDRPEGAFRYKDGQTVEAVLLRVPDESEPVTFKLHRSINGDRPPAGSVVEVDLTNELHEEARIGRSGRPYIAKVRKFTVVGFKVVKPAAAAA